MERESLKGKFISAIEMNPPKGLVSTFEYFNIESIEINQLEQFINDSANYNLSQFLFDKVFPSSTQQKIIYNDVALPVIQHVFKGMNGSILAYGQTGTGKTHTMEGFLFSQYEDFDTIIDNYGSSIIKFIGLNKS